MNIINKNTDGEASQGALLFRKRKDSTPTHTQCKVDDLFYSTALRSAAVLFISELQVKITAIHKMSVTRKQSIQFTLIKCVFHPVEDSC